MRQATSAPATGEIGPDVAWAAVSARDARSDGRFVYGVRTTGVFCRPSCGSRRPLRRNVRFFATAAEAERSGFRACKRCRPTAPDGSASLVETVRRLIEGAGDGGVTLQTLARQTGATPTRVQRAFKRATGLSPKEYQDTRRGERFREHLRAGASVTRAGIEAGYSSTSRVHHRAAEVLGMTPNAFRKKGKGMRIRFGTTSTPFGALIVAYTDRGICSVALGETAGELETQLRRQFSAAEIGPAGPEARERIDAVVSTLRGGNADVPIDLSGTAFQLLVWRALQRIPRGETRSYSALAASLGRPSAARAVARACAQNALAVVVPCHRVIREDGALGGYRWGIDRKRRLLDDEAAGSKP
jgi:AraC family transcriptional regulator of adaptative response/methylated-DNA-[protein]-cysteine methyltransferase